MASASVVVLTAQVAAATKTVSGTLTIPDQASPTFSKSAVAVITLLDRSPGPQTGAIIGQQTIAAPKAVPLAYSVSYDAAVIDYSHAYIVLAAIIDGANTWQNPDGRPTITGGPTVDLKVKLQPLPKNLNASVSGKLTKGPTSPSTSAAALVAVINSLDGRIIGWQAIPNPGPAPVLYNLGYDTSKLDPDPKKTKLLAVGGVVNAKKVWESAQGVPVAVSPSVTGVQIKLVQQTATIPNSNATPTPKPTASPKPTPSRPQADVAQARPSPPPSRRRRPSRHRSRRRRRSRHRNPHRPRPRRHRPRRHRCPRPRPRRPPPPARPTSRAP